MLISAPEQDMISLFFYNGIYFRRDVIYCTILLLQRILRWFRRQNRYHFYCSSLLIVYDGNILLNEHATWDNFTRSRRDGVGDQHPRHFIQNIREKGNSTGRGGNSSGTADNSNSTNPNNDSSSSSSSSGGASTIEEEYRQYIVTHPTQLTPLSTSNSRHEVVQVKIIDLAHTILVSSEDTVTDDVTVLHHYSSSLGQTEPHPAGVKVGGIQPEGDIPLIGTGVDVGYIYGLENLLHILEQLMRLVDNSPATVGVERRNLLANVTEYLNSSEIRSVQYTNSN